MVLFVLRHDSLRTLFRHSDGHDLISKLARLPRLGGALVRLDGVRILVRASHAMLFRRLIGTLPHVLLTERVCEAVVQNSIG